MEAINPRNFSRRRNPIRRGQSLREAVSMMPPKKNGLLGVLASVGIATLSVVCFLVISPWILFSKRFRNELLEGLSGRDEDGELLA